MNHSDILELLIRINRQDIIYACHLKNAEILHERYGDVTGFQGSTRIISWQYALALRSAS